MERTLKELAQTIEIAISEIISKSDCKRKPNDDIIQQICTKYNLKESHIRKIGMWE